MGSVEDKNTVSQSYTSTSSHIGGFCYGPRGQETPISQASESFRVGIKTLNIMVSLKPSISLSKNNFKHHNYDDFSGFY